MLHSAAAQTQSLLWLDHNCGSLATDCARFLRNPRAHRVKIRLVDSSADWCYNRDMMRKKRTDRNHIIYELRVHGLAYIGVTAKTETTVNKSVLARAAKHYYRAKTENKAWLLCEALRGLRDKSEIEVLVHEVVRGKAAAHKREVELRRLLNPALNTDCRGD